MEKRLISYRCNIITPTKADKLLTLEDHVINIQDGKIRSIIPYAEDQGEWQDYRDCIALPGFIDLHAHISQFYVKGAHEPALLPWLQKHVFPAEKHSKNPDYARKISRLFFEETIRKATSFSVIYTAPFREAADAAFEIASMMGIKAKIGMSLMDTNSPDYLMHSRDYALSNSIDLEENWTDPTLGHIFSPRFALSCSPELMREIGKYAQANSSFIQTHLSENPEEIRQVLKAFGQDSYTEVYRNLGLLTNKTILGHAIHLSDDELDTIKLSGAAIAHCPDSNFFLKSGVFPLSRIKEKGIPFALGSDIAAGTSLFMPYHAKMMNYRQDCALVSAQEMLFRITLRSAEILDLDTRIGSIESGKDADISFFKLPPELDFGEHALSPFFFASDIFKLKQFLIDGKERL